MHAFQLGDDQIHFTLDLLEFHFDPHGVCVVHDGSDHLGGLLLGGFGTLASFCFEFLVLLDGEFEVALQVALLFLQHGVTLFLVLGLHFEFLNALFLLPQLVRDVLGFLLAFAIVLLIFVLQGLHDDVHFLFDHLVVLGNALHVVAGVLDAPVLVRSQGLECQTAVEHLKVDLASLELAVLLAFLLHLALKGHCLRDQSHLELVQLLYELLLVLLVLCLDDGHLAQVLLDRSLIFLLLVAQICDELLGLLDLLIDLGGDAFEDGDLSADFVDLLTFGVDEGFDLVALLVDLLLLALAVADLDGVVLLVLLLPQTLEEGRLLEDVLLEAVALVL